MELTPDLPPELVPIAWLVGTWRGAGVGGYPTQDEHRFGQEVRISHEGRPFLVHESRTWLLDDDGATVRPIAHESGFWRPTGDGAVELLLAHPTGLVEVYLGEVDGARVELRTDVVARTATGSDYTAGHRLYGLVEGDLLWAYDVAAQGHPLQPLMSARLKRDA